MTVSALIAVLLSHPTAPVPPPSAPAQAQTQATPAQSLSDEEVRTRVVALLGAIDRPVPAGAWRDLGAQAVPVLQEIAQDRRQLAFRRSRALGVLGLLAPSQAAPLATSMAQDEQEHYLVRLGAMHTARAVLPPAQFEALMLPLMKGSLDVRVRGQAGALLAERPANCQAVQRQLGRERESDRSYFHTALERCR